MFYFLKPRNGPVVDRLESKEIVYAADQPEYIPLLMTAPIAPSAFSVRSRYLPRTLYLRRPTAAEMDSHR